jgi:hypothetical protein
MGIARDDDREVADADPGRREPGAVSPTPSSPLLLLPQQKSRLVVCTPQVWYWPAATESQLR